MTMRLPQPCSTTLIEASAGTGKTHAISTLAALFVAERGVPISQVGVVTFSRAATATLKSRVRTRLQGFVHALSHPQDEDDDLIRVWQLPERDKAVWRARLDDALNGFDHAPILTTHAFFGTLIAAVGPLADHDHSERMLPNDADLVYSATSDVVASSCGRQPLASFAQCLEWVKKSDFAPDAALVASSPDVADFVQTAREAIETRKRCHGVYTFDDMLLRAQEAMSRPGAAARASGLYPVLLMDEFQDTDTLQWEVVRDGFLGRSTVVLVGDPKQSIYGFRGADSLSYRQGAQASDKLSLHVNYRSSEHMVQAVSQVFAGLELGVGVDVPEVRACPSSPRLLRGDGQDADKPLRIRRLPHVGFDEAGKLVLDDLVADILGLLKSGLTWMPSPTPAEPHPGRHPFRPNDIAVLVNSNELGTEVLHRLSAASVPTVFSGTQSVFTSEAGDAWLALLTALESEREDRARAACLTSLIGWDVSRLANPDDTADLADMMGTLSEILSHAGPLGLLRWLCENENLMLRLVGSAERDLTDLRHIAQLMQKASSTPSYSAWLSAQRSRGDDQPENSRRLTRDDRAVTVMTIHKAKGLQFPAVYLPDLGGRVLPWKRDGRTWGERTVKPLVFHDPARSGRRSVDLGPVLSRESAAQNSEDRATEELRKAYVALTRATVLTTTWWGPLQFSESSALTRILLGSRPRPPASVPLPTTLALDRDRFPEMAVENVSPRPASTYQTGVTAPQFAPSLRGFSRVVDQTWRRTSFTGLTAGTHDAIGWDEPLGEADDVSMSGQAPDLLRPSPMAHLPAGTAFGSLVHAVFEHADPAAPDNELRDLIRSEIARSGMTGFTPEELEAAMRPGLATPLGPIADNMSLAQIPLSDRLAELAFELPLANDEKARVLSDVGALCDKYLPATDLLHPYGRLLAELTDVLPLRGFLTGSIDAVLRVSGRYVVVDYKTNWLGGHDTVLPLGNYTPGRMAQAMMDSHYPLQALLYCVALHRFLRWRLKGYDPTIHLGGAAYLFVRGMAGPDTPVVDGTPCGVFPWHVPSGLVIELSDLLSAVAS
ncbi:MAG: UvrD-helicase domain-containing protein [Propionibacteriaceae bacterium]|jgi:exodeoxyribonuclease V beta subunit|nr:UvrD-helicase domain-containing protein [Propionibacteriaceae bacterium]